MRIAVVTIYDPKPNYGNKLQNYAVETTLKEIFNAEVQTLYVEEQERYEGLKWIFHILTRYHWARNKEYWYDMAKIKRFDKFNRRRLHGIPLTEEMLETVDDSYDYFVIGSDQVWNPNFYPSNSKLKEKAFLLSFVTPEHRVCFSPSFGVSYLPNEWKNWFQEQLTLFPRISVREETGVQIVRELTGKDAEVLIDPTLMLEAEEWKKLAKKPRKVNCNKKYILTYFLGEKNKRIHQDLKKYSKDIGAEVYSLLDISDLNLYQSGPENFLYLIQHASVVMTDSFHACVFSFLFGKPFLVYPRIGKANNMMSRIEHLLIKFSLERKFVDSGLPNELLECDYSEGYSRLKAEREKVIDYLKSEITTPG